MHLLNGTEENICFFCVCQFSTCSFTLLPLSPCVSSYSTPFSVHKFMCNKEECLLGSIPNASQTFCESEYKNPFHAVPKKAPELYEDSAKELKCLITFMAILERYWTMSMNHSVSLLVVC